MRPLTLLVSLAAAAGLSAAAPATRDMNLTSADGFALQGTLTVPEGHGKRPVVILAHQYQLDRSSWAPLVEKLNARGIATLALDLRGHGKSTQKGGTTIAVTDDFMASAKTVGLDQIPDDLALAAQWVRKQPGIDGRHVGLAGASIGALSALLASPAVRPVAVLALSPAGTAVFGAKGQQSMVAAATKAHAALMVFASADDKESAENAAALRPLFGTNVRIFDGKQHGAEYLAERSDVMAVFLVEYLAHPHRGGAAEAPKTGPAETIPSEKVQ